MSSRRKANPVRLISDKAEEGKRSDSTLDQSGYQIPSPSHSMSSESFAKEMMHLEEVWCKKPRLDSKDPIEVVSDINYLNYLNDVKLFYCYLFDLIT